MSDTPPTRQPSLLDYAVGNARAGGPSSVEGVGPALAGRILNMVPYMPPDLQRRFGIESGERDAARQAIVNPTVKDSRHMHGLAVDLVNDPGVIQWITQHPQYGVGFPLTYMGPKEYNHMEMIDPQSGARLPMDYAATADPQFKSGLPSVGSGTSAFGLANANLPGLALGGPGVAMPAQTTADTASPPVNPALAAAALSGDGGLGDVLARAAKLGQPPAAPAPAPAPFGQASVGNPMPLGAGLPISRPVM